MNYTSRWNQKGVEQVRCHPYTILKKSSIDRFNNLDCIILPIFYSVIMVVCSIVV
jgi:hypothetical protein